MQVPQLSQGGRIRTTGLLCTWCPRLLCGVKGRHAPPSQEQQNPTQGFRLVSLFAAKSQEKLILFLYVYSNVWNLQYVFEHSGVSVSSVKPKN